MPHISISVTHKKEKSWLQCQFHDVQRTTIIKPHEFKISNEDISSLSHIESNVVDRIRGSIFGLALGNALGAHVELRPHAFMVDHPVKDLEGGGTWGLQPGQFTDDTSMALCLANSLIACRGFVPYDQLVRYKWWYRHGYLSSTGSCFAIGAATRNSIKEFENRQKIFAHEHGIPLDEIDSLSDPDLLQAFDVNCSQPHVAGNGALKRLAPVPLFFYKYPEMAVEYSEMSSKITHGDEKSIDACRYYGALIVAALQGEKKEALLTERFYHEHEEWFGNREIHPDIMKIAKGSYKKYGGYEEGIRGKGYVVDALEAALWAFWSDEDSFEKGVLNAVNLGDDTDTTAAIYGQLAGAYYSHNKLPKKWVERIYAKDFILCVSSWVAYEGDQWATTQAIPDINQIVNCISRIPTTNKSNRTNAPTVSTTKHTSNSSRQNTSFVCDITENTIARKVIDPNGRLGSFYDACQDHMELKTVPLNIKTKTVIPPIECRIINGEKLEGYNILRFIDFPIDLRLSILSNLVPSKGIIDVLDYPFAINQYTRIFYYSYVVRQQAVFEKKSIHTMKNSANTATHIITAIDSGVDVVVLMRVSADGQKHTDSALQQLCNCLKQDKEYSIDDHILAKIDSVYVYSNNSYISRSKTLIDVIKEIIKIKKDSKKHQPCNYILHPIDMFYSDPSQHRVKFIPTEPGIGKIVEDRWLRFLYAEKLWGKLQKNLDSEIWRSDLKDTLDSLNNRFTELAKKYDKERKNFKSMIVNSRQGKHPQENLLYQLDIEKHQAKDKQQIDDFKYKLQILKEKDNFIKTLKDDGFEYRTAASYKIEKHDTEETIQKKLGIYRQRQRFLCSNDRLNDIYWTELQKTLKQMLNEKKQTPNLKLIYVDVTYASCELDSFKVFPLKELARTHSLEQETEWIRVKIVEMVRPITEAIRNIIRNKIINESRVSQQWIELQPKSIDRPSAICFNCQYSISTYSNFFIIQYKLHEYGSRCMSCQCSANRHFRVDYQLDYQLVGRLSCTNEDLENWFQNLLAASLHLGGFLNHNMQPSSEDPFLVMLNRMIYEEGTLSEGTQNRTFNGELHRRLQGIVAHYKKYMESVKEQTIHNDLKSIIGWIEHVKKIPIIRKQMDAIRGASGDTS